MKAQILIVIVIGIAYCQLNPGTAINSCGKTGSAQPASSNDCKPGGEKSLCCFVDIPDKQMKYCAFMPNTKLENDVVTEFKDVIGQTNVNVVCNSSMRLCYNVMSSLLFVLLTLFFL